MARRSLRSETRSRVRTELHIAALLALATILALAPGCACFQPTVGGVEGRKQEGTSADFKTKDGVYDGYRVERGCAEHPDRGVLVRVVGTGTYCFEGECDDGHFGAKRVEGLQRFNEDIRKELGRWLSGTGIGFGCEPRAAAHAYVLVWVTLDRVIHAIGAHLREEGVREEVIVAIEGDTVPE